MKMIRWVSMLFLVSLAFGCNLPHGIQGAKQTVNQEVKIILETINGYVREAEIAALRSERTFFELLREVFQKRRIDEPESGMGSRKSQAISYG